MATKSIAVLPLVVIVGPTASGKTSLAIELAEKCNGEIICADSRTIYKGMDVGTAKPTSKDRERVPHWGLDLVDPNEPYTAAEFKRYAEQKVDEIRSRGHIPFLVGGTGLYIDAVIFNYQFGNRADEVLRMNLNKLNLNQLYEYCYNNNIQLPENEKNKRYLIRAIEKKGESTSRSHVPISGAIIVGITTDRVSLRNRIEQRIEQLLKDGVVEEAILLGKKYGWESQAMTGNIYPIIRAYLQNQLTYDEMMVKSTTIDWRLAKRQLTWLRRNPHITWLELNAARQYLQDQLVIN